MLPEQNRRERFTAYAETLSKQFKRSKMSSTRQYPKEKLRTRVGVLLLLDLLNYQQKRQAIQCYKNF